MSSARQSRRTLTVPVLLSALLLLPLGALTSAALAPVLYSETFDARTDLEDFLPVAGDWKVEDQRLVGGSFDHSIQSMAYWGTPLTSGATRPVRLDFDASFLRASTEGEHGGIMLSTNPVNRFDGAHGYEVSYLGSRAAYRVVTWNDGWHDHIVESDASYGTPGARWSVYIDTSLITVQVDGATVLETSTTAHEGPWYLGFWTYRGGEIAFDNVRVTTYEAPTVEVPADVQTTATGPQGATVAFAVSARDGVGAPLAATCSHASGIVFPIGTTTVACSATDAGGKRGTGSFRIVVAPRAPEAPRELEAETGAAPGEIALTWLAPAWDGGAPISEYRVYRLASQGETLVASTTSTEIVIPDNSIGVRHHFVVRAVNSAGEGDRSNSADAAAYGLPGPQTRPGVELRADGSVVLYLDADGDGGNGPGETLVVVPALP